MPTGGYHSSRQIPRREHLPGPTCGCPRSPRPGVPGRREAAAEPHRSHFAPPPPALAPGENPPPCLGGAAAAPLRSRRSAPARAALRGRRHSHAAARRAPTRGAPARAEPGPAEPNRAGPGAAGPGAAAPGRRGTAREPPEDVGGGSGVRAAGEDPVPGVPRCPEQNGGRSPMSAVPSAVGGCRGSGPGGPRCSVRRGDLTGPAGTGRVTCGPIQPRRASGVDWGDAGGGSRGMAGDVSPVPWCSAPPGFPGGGGGRRGASGHPHLLLPEALGREAQPAAPPASLGWRRQPSCFLLLRRARGRPRTPSHSSGPPLPILPGVTLAARTVPGRVPRAGVGSRAHHRASRRHGPTQPGRQAELRGPLSGCSFLLPPSFPQTVGFSWRSRSGPSILCQTCRASWRWDR